MNVSSETRDGIGIITVTGDINQHSAPGIQKFGDAVESFFATLVSKIVVDFTGVTSINCPGDDTAEIFMASLLAHHALAQEKGGRLVLAIAEQNSGLSTMQGAINFLGMGRLFEIVETKEAAIEKLR